MRCLLVIDDEEEIRKLLSRFTDRNYQVVTASSGEEGLDVIETQPIDAVLLDINCKRNK